MKKPLVSYLLLYFLYALFAVGVVVTVTLPFALDHYLRYFYDAYSVREGYRSFLLVFLTAAGIMGLWIIMELILMLRTIGADPFVSRNVKALRRMGVVAIAAAALFLGKCFVYFTVLTFACGFILLVCGLLALTLKNLFAQAVAYKEENTLTI